MTSLQEVEALAHCGLRGDRYADPRNRKSPDYQVTLIEIEFIEGFSKVHRLPLAPYEPRRNLVTTGVRLNELHGKRILVGEVELKALELCEPCLLFSRRTHREVVRYFAHRGGLRCSIVRGGIVRLGDSVRQRIEQPAYRSLGASRCPGQHRPGRNEGED